MPARVRDRAVAHVQPCMAHPAAVPFIDAAHRIARQRVDRPFLRPYVRFPLVCRAAGEHHANLFQHSPVPLRAVIRVHPLVLASGTRRLLSREHRAVCNHLPGILRVLLHARPPVRGRARLPRPSVEVRASHLRKRRGAHNVRLDHSFTFLSDRILQKRRGRSLSFVEKILLLALAVVTRFAKESYPFFLNLCAARFNNLHNVFKCPFWDLRPVMAKNAFPCARNPNLGSPRARFTLGYVYVYGFQWVVFVRPEIYPIRADLKDLRHFQSLLLWQSEE